ncbi:hypothetical protein PPL_06361 [Heterostelium album PN500]|uniref:Uncharacterized protein n=1 Tax=Heterostelium pallidum (strain ATCC 26659 / Pp 5 / PN500) TaxID=670386 RepID=D3BCY3_HETP5|nr:hypothetical protein PPL_06361 [Heterostelium album PN500]EFA80775.1 hypothetical protein PPL_06361 [Heterostelium album PN500]|eukprot:XP_020432894.1 hypothetical protein PPL_06361 [Heterostelium album PN500]
MDAQQAEKSVGHQRGGSGARHSDTDSQEDTQQTTFDIGGSTRLLLGGTDSADERR